jgi:NitT/TauT family transport system permease protein
MNPTGRFSLRSVIPPVAVLFLVIAAWESAAWLGGFPRLVLPGPFDVLAAAKANGSKLLFASGLTAAGALCGFAASVTGGTLIGLVFSQSAAVRRSLFPYAIFLQTVPIIAVAPLIALWSGYGFRSVVIVSFIVSVFPIVTNATAGLTSIDPDLLDLFRLHGASRWQTLIKLRLPSSVPSIVTGAQSSSGLAVIGTIVGEFFVGDVSGPFGLGLGYLVRQSSELMKTDLLFCSVIASTLLGLLVFAGVSVAGRTILARWGR